MKEDYKAAKKKADKEVRDAIREGVSPYLPVLDSIEEVKLAAGQRHLGLMELPLNRIKGNKEVGRNSAFARNFMPLFAEDSEFAIKWSALYDSYKTEGIRDAIKVYEYMNQYYVQEGNKRVSVSKFGGTEYILADVTRIIPAKSDNPEVIAYYEYMDFYKLTKNFLIVFTEPGEYQKLAELLGQDLENPWPDSVCSDLRSAFYRFGKVLKRELKVDNEYTLSTAFLMYISIFPLKTFEQDSDDQILRNIRLARYELLAQSGTEDIEFLESAPEEVRQGGLMSIFSREKKYTDASPLKVAFIYESDPDESRWTDSHEAGRLYVDEMTGDNVVTAAYFANEAGSVADAMEKAVSEGSEIIFAVSPDMIMDSRKKAVMHPSVKFLNCSVGHNNPSLRCYHGKIYEAAFLMGIYAADTLLREYGKDVNRTIGYISRVKSSTARANLNAFAIGVSLVDPDCRISLRKITADNPDPRGKWDEEGVVMYVDIEYSTEFTSETRPGIFMKKDGKDTYIGTSYFNWGKYYLQIVRSVLTGTWNIGELAEKRQSANYWFGLSTGVVDVRIPKIPYQTEKLLSFFRDAITRGDLDPFSGEIRTSKGEKIDMAAASGDEPEGRASKSRILSMRWLNENIDGEF